MGDSRIGPAAWLDIEPLLSNAAKALTNRQKALQDSEDLAKRAGEILAGTPPGERTPPAEAAEVPAEEVTEDKSGEKTWTIVFEDTDWRSRIHELVACLRSYGLNAIADAIMRRLPRELKPDDRDYEKYDRGNLAVYREREADEANAVNWLLNYLQAVRREQKPPAVKPSEAAQVGENRDKPAGGKSKPAATVNERMAGTIMENSEAMGWNSPQWARHLKCAKSSVVDTATWKKLESARLQAKAERMKDRRRKPKASDSRRD